MRQLLLSKAFERSYKKFTNNNKALRSSISKAISKLENDAFDPSLRTHKLSGKFAAHFACSCGYDCRIIFVIEKVVGSETEHIILLDIGTHNDVY